MSIEVKELSLYADRKRSVAILNNVNCSIKKHSLTLLIGQSGTGKTTLLRTLAGLLRTDEGSICYDGEPLWQGRRANRALMLRYAAAFQFPEHQLFARTVQGEFDYSLRPYKVPAPERQQRIRTALAGQRLDPDCLADSPLTMSGGQKRRVALATIMAAETEWLLLDEPSAGLDGQSLTRFKQELADWKTRSGIVLATHDIDAFLPIADRVLIMQDGTIAADVTPAELMAEPHRLTQYGIGLTGIMELAAELKQTGITLPATATLTPALVAKAIDAALRPNLPERTRPAHPPLTLDAAQAGQTVQSEQAITRPQREANPQQTAASFLYKLDVKLKWLIYMLISTGIFIQNKWEGAAAALLVSLLCITLLTPDDRRKMLRLLKPLLLLVVLAALLSGLRLSFDQGLSWSSRFGFSFDTAGETLRRLGLLFEVTVISLVFTLSTSTTAMKQGLELLLRPLRRLGIRTEMLALAASLVLRFIPLIIEEAERFAAIARARGKRVSRSSQIHARDIPVFVIPLMIALFQAVEELIVAIELKKYMSKTSRPLPAPGNGKRVDWRAAAAGIAMFAGLVCVRIYF